MRCVGNPQVDGGEGNELLPAAYTSNGVIVFTGESLITAALNAAGGTPKRMRKFLAAMIRLMFYVRINTGPNGGTWGRLVQVRSGSNTRLGCF